MKSISRKFSWNWFDRKICMETDDTDTEHLKLESLWLILVIEMQTVVQLPFHIRQRWREVWRKVARGLFAYQDCIVLKVVVVHQLNEKNIKISQWINLLALVACSNIPLMLWYCQTLGETGGRAGVPYSSSQHHFFINKKYIFFCEINFMKNFVKMISRENKLKRTSRS